MAWLILLFHIFLSTSMPIEGQSITKPGCQEKCGAVDIPYPFGIGSNCSRDEGFVLTCNMTDSGKFVPFHGNVQVLNITVATAQARLYNYIAWQCYDNSSDFNRNKTSYLNLSQTIYRLSSLDNKFTAIGCETLAFNEMSDGNFSYRTGCVSICYNKKSLTNGSCSGNGCCQTSVPSGINYYNITFDKNYNSSQVWNFSLCSYAVVMAADSFQFSTSYISTYDFWDAHNGTVPVVLDWSIGIETCEAAKLDKSNYACVSNNSLCLNSINGQGYICKCSTGYQGNPYLLDGCRDLDECKDNKSICNSPAICVNILGGYECNCPHSYQANATLKGTCYLVHNQSLPKSTKMAIGITMGLLILLICLFLMHMAYERRRMASIRKRYFQQYGGPLLEDLKWNHGNTFTIFMEKELKEATNNFHETRMLGQGGNGTVYKGTLKSNQDVAIKKCKIIDERNKKDFGNEILVLSQINHINIVRILGCCLEVEIPIVVYEFISNGNLFDLLHSASSMSLNLRLRIAQEAAEALAYLHSWASPPIVHCDVKSANILLDENFVAKVSDFGASALAPSDQNQLLTLVQGTRGYLDPECMRTGQLTVKSDVYSFGVVLLELLTRKKPFYSEGLEERCLSSSFLTAMKDSTLHTIFDEQILIDDNMNLIMRVAELAKECLNMEGEKRPQMREVAERLDKMRNGMMNPRQDYYDEIQSLRGQPSSNLDLEMTSYQSLEKKAMLVMEAGR